MDGLDGLIADPMLPLRIGSTHERLRVLCLGAHADDIEIGCAGTLLRWLKEYRHVEVTWAVMSATDARATEARASARALMRGADRLDVHLGDLEDAHFPADFRKAKSMFSELRKRVRPDVILTHRLEDRHQDHRLVAEITWQTWRDHLIFEYEIPKYEGDLGFPNVFVPLRQNIARRKVAHLVRHFASQRAKSWFSPETFLSLMRLRGVECGAAYGFAEGFLARKAIL